MAYKSIETKRMADKSYREKNKEKIKKQKHEYYLAHREETIQRTKKYHHEHKEERKKYYKENYAEIRLEVLAKIDPSMKCARCGCDETRFLDVNHIKGGGYEEHKKRGKKVAKNMILLIHTGKRGVEDLNLLCRICNALDYLERKYGHTRLRVVWDKPVTNTTIPSIDKVLLVSKKSKN